MNACTRDAWGRRGIHAALLRWLEDRPALAAEGSRIRAIVIQSRRHRIESGAVYFQEFVIACWRIRGDVFAMAAVIDGIADTVFVEASLPDLSPVAGYETHGMRESALDALHAALQRVIFGRSDEQVQVIGHDHKWMQRVAAFIAIVEEHLAQKTRAAV